MPSPEAQAGALRAGNGSPVTQQTQRYAGGLSFEPQSGLMSLLEEQLTPRLMRTRSSQENVPPAKHSPSDLHTPPEAAVPTPYSPISNPFGVRPTTRTPAATAAVASRSDGSAHSGASSGASSWGRLKPNFGFGSFAATAAASPAGSEVTSAIHQDQRGSAVSDSDVARAAEMADSRAQAWLNSPEVSAEDVCITWAAVGKLTAEQAADNPSPAIYQVVADAVQPSKLPQPAKKGASGLDRAAKLLNLVADAGIATAAAPPPPLKTASPPPPPPLPVPAAADLHDDVAAAHSSWRTWALNITQMASPRPEPAQEALCAAGFGAAPPTAATRSCASASSSPQRRWPSPAAQHPRSFPLRRSDSDGSLNSQSPTDSGEARDQTKLAHADAAARRLAADGASLRASLDAVAASIRAIAARKTEPLFTPATPAVPNLVMRELPAGRALLEAFTDSPPQPAAPPPSPQLPPDSGSAFGSPQAALEEAPPTPLPFVSDAAPVHNTPRLAACVSGTHIAAKRPRMPRLDLAQAAAFVAVLLLAALTAAALLRHGPNPYAGGAKSHAAMLRHQTGHTHSLPATWAGLAAGVRSAALSILKPKPGAALAAPQAFFSFPAWLTPRLVPAAPSPAGASHFAQQLKGFLHNVDPRALLSPPPPESPSPTPPPISSMLHAAFDSLQQSMSWSAAGHSPTSTSHAQDGKVTAEPAEAAGKLTPAAAAVEQLRHLFKPPAGASRRHDVPPVPPPAPSAVPASQHTEAEKASRQSSVPAPPWAASVMHAFGSSRGAPAEAASAGGSIAMPASPPSTASPEVQPAASLQSPTVPRPQPPPAPADAAQPAAALTGAAREAAGVAKPQVVAVKGLARQLRDAVLRRAHAATAAVTGAAAAAERAAEAAAARAGSSVTDIVAWAQHLGPATVRLMTYVQPAALAVALAAAAVTAAVASILTRRGAVAQDLERDPAPTDDVAGEGTISHATPLPTSHHIPSATETKPSRAPQRRITVAEAPPSAARYSLRRRQTLNQTLDPNSTAPQEVEPQTDSAAPRTSRRHSHAVSGLGFDLGDADAEPTPSAGTSRRAVAHTTDAGATPFRRTTRAAARRA